MDNTETSRDLVIQQSKELQISQHENKLLGILSTCGLPIESIFIPIPEREIVFMNIPSVINKVPGEQRKSSAYISKFIAAASSGLFDAALNYLWDETILELRKRVAQYDLSYFYDNAISTDKRKDFKDENDLTKISDSGLINGAKEIGLISEIGFKHLDYIRFMRNWVSAAHPNQNEITGIQLVAWLETCIKEVISLPLSTNSIEIARLLQNIKNTSISANDAKQIATFFVNLTQEQVNSLASGLFGIYCRKEAEVQTRQNISNLLPYIWDRVDEKTRQDFGIKYGKFVANNDQDEKTLARQFLQIVSGEPYIPADLRVSDIKSALENLLDAHREMNNFYNEPPFARELQRLVGSSSKVPQHINNAYVLGIVEVFLTNGNGIAYNAEPVYKKLIDSFSQEQAIIALLSFTELGIASHLQFQLCQKQFRALLVTLKGKVTAPAVKELIEKMEAFTGPLDKMKEDSTIQRYVTNFKKIELTKLP